MGAAGRVQPLSAFSFRDVSSGSPVDVTHAVVAALAAAVPGAETLLACTQVFPASGGGGPQLAKTMGVPFLGKVPLDPSLSLACEHGR